MPHRPAEAPRDNCFVDGSVMVELTKPTCALLHLF
jgi:hypothetical protein